MGRLTPKEVHVRLLLSDTSKPLALPVLANNDPSDSADVRERLAGISARHVGAIREAIDELADLELVAKASVEVRAHGASPLFKAYIVNDTDVFFGYYPVAKHDVRIDGKKRSILDPMGKDSVLFQHTDDGDPGSTGSQFVTQTKAWFESIWNTIAVPAQ
ncbi:MAG: GntR family transcriptional regulator [Actinomycetes bacterium]